ncbi:MAG: hypothetical protein H8D45_18840 [Bacteroidetes bacterium]|nr:hypothetical protein [Bacteroidota bacterium]
MFSLLNRLLNLYHAIRKNEISFVSKLGFASIILLLFIVSYNRFLVYHSLYHPLYKLAWDPSLFQGDMLRNSLIREVSIVFLTFLKYLTPLSKCIGEENLLFMIFITFNALNIYVCYKTAKLYGSKNFAVLLIIVLFSYFGLLEAAGVSIIISHHFFATNIAMLAVFSIFYFYFAKKYLFLFITIAFTSLLHIKTGFAIVVPFSICIIWDLLDPNLDRRKIVKGIFWAIPVFILTALFFLSFKQGFSDCGEYYMKIWTQRLSSEYDILKGEIVIAKTYNYFLLNALAIYLYKRFNLSSSLGKGIFRLIIAANIGLLIGIIVSIIHNNVVHIYNLMLFPWPKIGMVSTYISIFIICFYLMKDDLKCSITHTIVVVLLYFVALTSWFPLDIKQTIMVGLKCLMTLGLLVSGIWYFRPAEDFKKIIRLLLNPFTTGLVTVVLVVLLPIMLSHKSEIPIFFGRYSYKAMQIIIAYGVLVLFFVLLTIFSKELQRSISKLSMNNSKKLLSEKISIRNLVASVIITSLVLGHVFTFGNLIHIRYKEQWNGTIYRIPSSFNLSEYRASLWINNNIINEAMIIYPEIVDRYRYNGPILLDDSKVRYKETLLKYSERPFYFYDEFWNIYGSCSKFVEYKRRRSVVNRWVDNKNLSILLENNIGYAVINKKDKEFFKIPENLSVYENEKLVIFDITKYQIN